MMGAPETSGQGKAQVVTGWTERRAPRGHGVGKGAVVCGKNPRVVKSEAGDFPRLVVRGVAHAMCS